MKPRTLISLFLAALPLAAGSTACTAETQQTADEPTATTDQALIGMAGNIMAWPAGPIAWNGLNGTWPINVWSPAAIGGLAFGLAGFNNLGLSVVGFPNMAAVPITTPWLNAFVPPIGAAGVAGAGFFGPAGLVAPAFGFTGAFTPFLNNGLGFGFGAFGGGAALQGAWLNGGFATGVGAFGTGFGALLNPTLTSSALMFNNLAAINTFTPWTFNVTFAAQSAAAATSFAASSMAAQMGALSIFATPIMGTALAAQTAAIPFMSIAFPIMQMPILPGTGFLGVGALPGVGLGAAALPGVGLL